MTSPSLHSGPQVAIGSYATVNTQAAAGRPAETQDATDLMIAKPRLGKADFGPNDPGVTVITADQGGNINLYEKRFFGGNELHLPRLPQLGLLCHGASGCVGTAPALRDRSDLMHRAAFRAGDRIVVKIVELCAARGAEAFRTLLRQRR